MTACEQSRESLGLIVKSQHFKAKDLRQCKRHTKSVACKSGNAIGLSLTPDFFFLHFIDGSAIN